jgi:hypothetical protein
MYVYIKIKIEKIKDRIFFIRKDHILRGRKERVTIWFWLAGRSYKGKQKTEKKYRRLSYIFCIWIKIPISVTRGWRDLIGLRFLVVHTIIFFSYLD